MEYKVVIVKSSGSELENALNKGWGVQHVAASNNALVYILQKRK